MFPSMAAPEINILCGYSQNCSFIRRVPPYHQFFWANFDDFQKMAYMLLVIFIYQIIHDSVWLTCLILLWNPPPVVNIGVKANFFSLFGSCTPKKLFFEAAILFNIVIYQIIHDSGWLSCLALLWHPPPVVNMGVKAKIWLFTLLLGSSTLLFTRGLTQRLG